MTYDYREDDDCQPVEMQEALVRYYCEDCDETFPADECELAYARPWSKEQTMHHEAGEVSIGGDGHGGRCCAEMDVPIYHEVREVKP